MHACILCCRCAKRQRGNKEVDGEKQAWARKEAFSNGYIKVRLEVLRVLDIASSFIV